MFSTLIPSTPYNLSSLTAEQAFDYIASQDAGLVTDHFSISGFIFDYAGEVGSELSADITDHYTEDNAAVQDHVALAPVKVVMRGLIGELRVGPGQAGLNGLLNSLQNSLTSINSYIGGKTPQAITKASKAISKVQNVTTQVSSAVSKERSLYHFFKDGVQSNSRQVGAYIYLKGLWHKRIPVTIETPHQIYENMLIESLKVTQTEDTKYESEFSITLKEIRKAVVVRTTLTSGVALRNDQASPFRNGGLNSTGKLDLSVLPSFTPGS